MQHMDPEGRTAAIKFLKNMNKETLIIIEHGLAEAASSTDAFDYIDVVKRGSEESIVEQARPKPVAQAAEVGTDAGGPSATCGKRPADAASADASAGKQAKTAPDNAPATAAPAAQAPASS
jgi:energy-coupling factor transporter ATP-binding protein EcfA2